MFPEREDGQAENTSTERTPSRASSHCEMSVSGYCICGDVDLILVSLIVVELDTIRGHGSAVM
jgi:hypothetical protein